MYNPPRFRKIKQNSAAVFFSSLLRTFLHSWQSAVATERFISSLWSKQSQAHEEKKSLVVQLKTGCFAGGVPTPCQYAQKRRTCHGNNRVCSTNSSHLLPTPLPPAAGPPNGTGHQQSATRDSLIIPQPSKVPVKRFLRRILIPANKEDFYRRSQNSGEVPWVCDG